MNCISYSHNEGAEELQWVHPEMSELFAAFGTWFAVLTVISCIVILCCVDTGNKHSASRTAMKLRSIVRKCCCKSVTDRQTDRQTDGRTDWTGGQAGRRAGGQAGRRAGGQAGRRAGGQAGRRAGGDRALSGRLSTSVRPAHKV